MKFEISLLLVLSILLSACAISQKPHANSVSTKNPVSKKENKMKIKWKLIANSYQGKNQTLSELIIINQNTVSLTDEWELFFNYAPSRMILKSDESEKVNIDHVNGDLFRMTPKKGFIGIQSNDSLTVKLVSDFWITKETEVPCGFYFVIKSGMDEKIVIPEFSFYSIDGPLHTTRHSEDLIASPDAESRFLDNIRLIKLPKSNLKKLIPTPFKLRSLMSRLVLTPEFLIVHEPTLLSEANYLNKRLHFNLGKELNISTKQINEKNNIFLSTGKINIGDAIYESGSESYTLRIQDGNIYIKGTDNAGVFYAIQSLLSLLPVETYKDPSEKILIEGVDITDKPRFGYRGMHLDVARNFQTKSSILKLLDLMAFYKMNKFHFHLTDDEGWRLEIPSIPELTEIGSKRGHTENESDMLSPAYGSGPYPDPNISAGTGFYSQEDFIEILKYASERHIEIIPEFDFPGHARAAIKAMKYRYKKYMNSGERAKAEVFLLSDLNDASEYRSVQNYNDNVVCVCQQSVYNFLDILVGDVFKIYQKAGIELKTFHIGGDEVPGGAWEKSPSCIQLMQTNKDIKNSNDLKGYFLNRVNGILKNYKLITAGWEEIGMHNIIKNSKAVHDVNSKYINDNFLLYSWNSVYGWGGEETAYKLANEGYKVVLSNVSPLYLDMAYDKDPKEPGFYWGGYVDEEDIFSWDPLDVYSSLKNDNNGKSIPKNDLINKTKLTDSGKSNIRGIQAQLWSETVKSEERLEYMILPRLIQVAEKAWAKEPEWLKELSLYEQEWNIMMNSTGQRELLRLEYLNGGYKFRIPVPGAIIKNGLLYANSSVPGFEIRFTTDGSEPVIESPKYTLPVPAESKTIRLKCFTPGGRGGRSIVLNNN